MLNRLLLEFYKAPNNGRQVVTLPGEWQLVLIPSEIMGPATLTLALSREPRPERWDDFETVGNLVGPNAVVEGSDPWGFGGCLLVIRDHLYAAWTGPDGIAFARATVDGRSLTWAPARQAVRGDVQLGDLFSVNGKVAIAYKEIVDGSTESVGIAWLSGDAPKRDAWKRREVHRGGPIFPPVATVDGNNRVHLAWADVAQYLHHVRLAGLEQPPKGEDETPVRVGGGRQPSILATDDGLLLASEDRYGHIQTFRNRGDGWGGRERLTLTHPWLTTDQPHSPQLGRDRHGVVWLVFADNTRRSLFWSRWQGKQWSAITNGPRLFIRPRHFEFNLLAIGRFTLQKEATAETHDVGMLLKAQPPAQETAYRRELVLDIVPDSGRKILFLDLLEVARIDRLTHRIETAAKHSENPLMETGPPGAFDEDRVFNHGSVIHDGERYRMWYTGIRKPRPGEPGQPWWDTIHTGYATSEDGIHWERTKVGRVEWDGSTDNNIVPYMRHSSVMIRDAADPDPERRYKGFYFWNSGEHHQIAREGKYGKTYDPREEKFLMDLLPSPDGLNHERIEGETRFPDDQVQPFSAIPQSVFRDEGETDPAKRFKAYGFMSMNLRRRGTCYLYSPDALHWTAHPEMPVIDPLVRGTPPVASGPENQVHDTVGFPYEGYYLALYQAQHSPDRMPIELAAGREPDHFHHMQPGEEVIPLGDADTWDALTIRPSMPIFLDEEIRIYYGGSRDETRDGATRRVSRPGLATLRRDGFASLHLPAGEEEGWVETIPFDLPEEPLGLYVNVRCDDGTALRAAVVDEQTGRPLSGLALDACKPVTGNRLEQAIQWEEADRIGPGPRRIRLQIELRRNTPDSDGGDRTAKLFAFWFDRS